MRFKRALCVALMWIQAAGVFAQTAIAQRVRRPAPGSQVTTMQQGLQIKLSEGAPVTDAASINPRPPAAPLAADETDRVLRRLPPLKAEAGDEQDFALRDKSLPPPRTGATVNASFPPAAPRDVTQPATGPLDVVRFGPEGDVPIAAQVSVTFSQPMVAVTSHADTIAEGVPVRLTPQPQGRWRWV